MPLINRNILLSAFGIHTGGGLVLLKALNRAIESRLKLAVLDARLIDQNEIGINFCRTRFVKKNFLNRLVCILTVAKNNDSEDILLCFNSLPPLTKTKSKVIVFVQAPHFADLHKNIQYNIKTAIRIRIETLWFKAGIHNCDEIWVQTSSMAEALALKYPYITIRIIPLVDDDICNGMPQNRNRRESLFQSKNVTLFYPADAVGHKNHVNIIKAWNLLWNQGCRPNLLLTLKQGEVDNILRLGGSKLIWHNNIINLGQISRCEVLKQLSKSAALIFPSLTETFGLPLIEAANLGIPILASERDFVRDVCRPVETFDPLSPKSISRAVLRFFGETQHVTENISASQFVDLLLNVSNPKY
jgi:glycosyltransferase involved in cell wall biosynthesis